MRWKVQARSRMATVRRFEVLSSAEGTNRVSKIRKVRFRRSRSSSDSPDTPTTALLPPTPFLSSASFAQPLALPTRDTPLFRCSLLSQLSFLSPALSVGEVAIGPSRLSSDGFSVLGVEGVGEYSAGQIREEMVRRNKVGSAV